MTQVRAMSQRLTEHGSADVTLAQARRSSSQLDGDQGRYERLRAAIARLVGRHAGGRVAVLIADGDERLGSVVDVADRELVLQDLYGQPCAIPLEKILSVQLLAPLRQAAGSRRV